MSEDDKRDMGSSWKDNAVPVAWISGVCAIIAGLIVSAPGLFDIYDHHFNKASTQITYDLEYTNSGTIKQFGVTVKVVLPDSVEYLPGSTFYADPNTGGKWNHVNVDSIISGGLYLDSYNPKGRTFIRFMARIPNNKDYTCGPNGVAVSVTAKSNKGTAPAESTIKVETRC
jgi:uncharacterized repeat protein (TIGR01451 family)